MAAPALSDAERARRGSWPAEIAESDLAAYFTLSVEDLRWLRSFRSSAAVRLGLAVHLCALRFLGFVPADVAAAPANVTARLAKRAGATPGALGRYARETAGRSRREHVEMHATAAYCSSSRATADGPGSVQRCRPWRPTPTSTGPAEAGWCAPARIWRTCCPARAAPKGAATTTSSSGLPTTEGPLGRRAGRPVTSGPRPPSCRRRLTARCSWCALAAQAPGSSRSRYCVRSMAACTGPSACTVPSGQRGLLAVRPISMVATLLASSPFPPALSSCSGCAALFW